ncbi:MAG: hypothetical protein LH647_13215 [Leptolyngbyaceae cyanobacterium CAN_BIN12]|nr:hypothetical protein [Leptolyngbyaceae cyanobacterium CAN_BIN12]
MVEPMAVKASRISPTVRSPIFLCDRGLKPCKGGRKGKGAIVFLRVNKNLRLSQGESQIYR